MNFRLIMKSASPYPSSRNNLKHFTVFLLLYSASCFAQKQLQAWQPGWMDIHHIQTGRGNATFMIFPDGTSMLFDAGEISETHERTQSERNSKAKPNGSKRPHEWLAEYIKRHLPDRANAIIDYAVISHFHDDHFGEWDSTLEQSKYGNYFKTGITGVADQIPINYLLDRGHRFPIDLKSSDYQQKQMQDEYHIVQTLNNYFKFIEVQSKMGMRYDTVVAGARDQIRLLHMPSKYPHFQVFNVASAGNIATGYQNRESFSLFKSGQHPGENPLSVAFKITYGKFDYFTGGDISGINALGVPDDNSIEASIAPVVGPVDVATLNHHGNRDAESPFFVRTIRPHVWIQQTWSSDHPGQDVLRRIMSKELYPGERYLLSTDLLTSNIQVIGQPSIDKLYASISGHIVLRVFEGGNRYSLFVLDDMDNSYRVVKELGPFQSR